MISNAKRLGKRSIYLNLLVFRKFAVYSEIELESRIIDNLQKFLLVLGKGFTFMGRQVRFTYYEEYFL